MVVQSTGQKRIAMESDLGPIKSLPILDVAFRLRIPVRGKVAMCFAGHDKASPSLSFRPDRNFWKCFGCGLKGTNIDLVMNVLGCDFRAALGWFAKEYGVSPGRHIGRRKSGPGAYASGNGRTVSRREIVPSEPESQFAPDPEIYAWLLARCGPISEQTGLSYLRSHGIPLEIASRFGVRELRDPICACRQLVERWGALRAFRSGLTGAGGKSRTGLLWKSYAIIFPFFMETKVEFLQGRLFNREPKYLNPCGIAKPLYNLDRLRTIPKGSGVFICEGVPDALALEAKGWPAIGVLGAGSFRREWVDHFLSFNVLVAPHADASGQTFKRNIEALFRARGKTIRSFRLPEGKKDIAEAIADMGEC